MQCESRKYFIKYVKICCIHICCSRIARFLSHSLSPYIHERQRSVYLHMREHVNKIPATLTWQSTSRNYYARCSYIYFILGCSRSVVQAMPMPMPQYEQKRKTSEKRNVREFRRNVRIERVATAAAMNKKENKMT